MRLKTTLFLAAISSLVTPMVMADDICCVQQDPGASIEYGYVGLIATAEQINQKLTFTTTSSAPFPGFTPINDSHRFSQSGFNGGLLLGFANIWSRWYFGMEISSEPIPQSQTVTWQGASSLTHTTKVTLTNYVNGDVLPGIRWAPGFVTYLRLGGAATNIQLQQDNINGATRSRNEVLGGVRAGIGFDWFISQKVSMGLDYIGSFYEKSRLNSTNGPVTAQLQNTINSNEIGIHLRYNFL